jgi:hypothetical protein
MNPPAIQCTQCGGELSPESLNQPGLLACDGCGAPLHVEVFPALYRTATTGRGGDAILTEDEASCFYHPQKKAVQHCDACGRFLCALCDCDLQGQHLCPVCLETGKQKGKLKNLQQRRTLYDNIALSLAIYPLLIFYFTIITAPLALFVALRFWNTPLSVVPRSKARFIAAIVLSSLQIGGWCVGLYFLITSL